MAGKPGFRVRSGWRRPDASLLSAFGNASSAQVADCMSRLGGMDAGIRPVWLSPRITGAALTVWCHSGDNLMLHKGLSLAEPGDILVVNTQGNVTNSGFGELIATSAVKIGVRGVIIDGTVRDVEAFEQLGLPVYSRGICANGCNKDGAGEVGTIIACGGVAVRPGDVIVADRDGVTVVPLDDAAEVAKLAAAQIAREEKRKAEIEKGVLVRPEIDEALRALRIID
ncbi:MAG TPA: 4-carboxy-4-hydroxy-2-oxoadipate aldolase/oxaloacetate decarboxylase [Bryobacteraceae bacterium]|nr:4-carboxy-4-hydroxy-2-oxoadipate aldolase/oxaloacetate decarboxylase [Bryobacteraceae bacterium]